MQPTFSMNQLLKPPQRPKGKGKRRQSKPLMQTGPSTQTKPSTKQIKDTIPKALREQVWIRQMGRVFEGKCPTSWCQNKITVFDFESGHNIPESKGGQTSIENLVPICSRCNRSMSDTYSFDEWCAKFSQQNSSLPRPFWKRLANCFS